MMWGQERSVVSHERPFGWLLARFFRFVRYDPKQVCPLIPICFYTCPTVCPWARPTSTSCRLMMICYALTRFLAIFYLLPKPKILTFKLDSF